MFFFQKILGKLMFWFWIQHRLNDHSKLQYILLNVNNNNGAGSRWTLPVAPQCQIFCPILSVCLQAWQPPPQLSVPSCHQSPPNSRAARLLSTNHKRVRPICTSCVITATAAKEIPVRGFNQAVWFKAERTEYVVALARSGKYFQFQAFDSQNQIN